ncbi:MAG: hypothetical protein C6I00_02195 [Nitratiruptor sp.]|nr:hypothetical protein [Nitratiruptor sp.]NPA84099.1 hypothetical protein [Campylobacterota bacterium]
MVRRLIIVLLASLLHGEGLQIEDFESPFVQEVRNDQNRTLRYEGRVCFQAPNLTHWIYTKPVLKEVLLIGQKLIVLEPELEQVTTTKLKEEHNVLALLQRAHPIAPNRYQLSYKGYTFQIATDNNGTIRQISYQDELANQVTIRFTRPVQNGGLSQDCFKMEIPAHFDRVYR